MRKNEDLCLEINDEEEKKRITPNRYVTHSNHIVQMLSTALCVPSNSHHIESRISRNIGIGHARIAEK